MQSVIDFDLSLLSPLQFEELCYELVEASGFSHIIWRRGGADGGRDIEACRRVSNGLVDDYDERWFFECKHHRSGVSSEHLSSKFVHGLAEEPDHLVFFISSYLTKDTRAWKEKMAVKANFKIHLIEGEKLKLLIKKHPEIAGKYFSTELQFARRAWIISDARPGQEALLRMTHSTTINLCTPFEMALLFYWSQGPSERDSKGVGPLWRNWIPLLAPLANTASPLLQEAELEFCEHEYSVPHHADGFMMAAHIVKIPGLGHTTGAYCAQLIDDEMIEVLIEQSDDLRVTIRHLKEGGGREFDRVTGLTISGRWRRRRIFAALGPSS